VGLATAAKIMISMTAAVNVAARGGPPGGQSKRAAPKDGPRGGVVVDGAARRCLWRLFSVRSIQVTAGPIMAVCGEKSH
jgi:hypothetical protein